MRILQQIYFFYNKKKELNRWNAVHYIHLLELILIDFFHLGMDQLFVWVMAQKKLVKDLNKSNFSMEK